MATSDITAQTFSSREVCLARAKEHLANHGYRAADGTLMRGARQWPDFEFQPEYLTLAGKVARLRQEYRRARRYLKAAVDREGSHVEARFLLGRTWLNLGYTERAIPLLADIANADGELVPWRAHACSSLCVAFSAMGLNKSAQDAIEKAAEFGLVSAQLMADEAFRLMRVGGFREAEVQLAKALQIDASCEDAFVRLANVLMIQGKLDAAMEVISYGIEQSPEALEFYRQAAEIQMARGHFKDAAAALEQAVALSPVSANADAWYFMAGQARYRAGESGNAQVLFRAVADKFPRSALAPEARERAGALADGKGEPRLKKLEGFPRTLQKHAFCAPNTLANVLQYIGAPTTQDDVAARVFRGGSSRWPDIVAFLAEQRGVAWEAVFASLPVLRACVDRGVPVVVTEHHGMSGHMLAIVGYDDAAGLLLAQDPRFLEPVEIPYRSFERAWEHDDRLSAAIVPEKHAGQLPDQSSKGAKLVADYIDMLSFYYGGRSEEALRLALDLRERDPALQGAARVQAQIALEGRDFEKLAALCQEALKTWPKAFWAWRHLGDALWVQGDPGGAMRAYREARRIDKRDKNLLYALGELHLAQGERIRGCLYLERALAEDPQFLPARRRLAEELLALDGDDLAKRHARMMVEFDPESSAARDFMRKLTGDTAVRDLTEKARSVQEAIRRVTEAQDQEGILEDLPDLEEVEDLPDDD